MKDFKIYIIVASILLVVYFVVEFNQPKPVVWTATYSKDDKIPFGTYILFNRINDIFPGDSVNVFREPVYNVLNDHQIEKGNYIIICEQIDLSTYDITKLKKFIEKGNDVFIAANAFGDTLKKELKLETDVYYNKDSVANRIHFVNRNLDQNKKYPLTKELDDYFFSEIDTAHAISLAQNDSLKTTFVKYSFGKGNLFLNSNPRFFTNYSLINADGAEYVAKVFSYLRNNKFIMWDEYYTQGRDGDRSIMRVFFRSTPLKWAYYISLVSFIVFVLYEKKRRQRVIPVIDPLKNSTVDFVNVVGQVYYEQHNNQNIAEKKILFLLEYLRNKYYLKTAKLDEEFSERLAQKTGISASFAKNFVSQINYTSVQEKVTDHELIQLNQLIEQFYSQSK